MASTFKNKWAENITHNAVTEVYEAGTNTTSILIGLTLTNNSSSDITATVTLFDSATGGNPATNDVVFLNAVSIPKNTALEIMRGNKIVLETGDKIKVQASAASSLNVFATLLELT